MNRWLRSLTIEIFLGARGAALRVCSVKCAVSSPQAQFLLGKKRFSFA